jgi:hypothetical protein
MPWRANMLSKLTSWLRPATDVTSEILGRHLDGDFMVFPMAETRTSPRQLATIGKAYGVKYPSEFVAHVCGRFPGLYVEVKEDVWPRPEPYDIGPFWSFLYAFHSFTSAPESEHWMRLDAAAEAFQQDTGLAAAPILRVVGDADLYCVNASAAIVRFNHETGEFRSVGMNFWQVLEHETKELRARKDQKVSGI